jgi:altronate dehydratase small subunit
VGSLVDIPKIQSLPETILMEDETLHAGQNGTKKPERSETRNRPGLESKNSEWAAIVLKPEDHVATALRRLDVGELARINMDNREIVVSILEEIPLCHKFAVTTIDAGQVVFKYGYEIGRATNLIPAGSHVHVHNLESNRAKPMSL